MLSPDLALELRNARPVASPALRQRVRAVAARAPEGAATEASTPRRSSASEGGPGTAYMLDRLEAGRRGDEILARVHEPLAQLARRSTRRVAPGAGPQLTASYLVDGDRVEEFRARVDELDGELEGVAIVCTGPWPPYSFTAEEPAR
jgi:hypothetical protein